MEPLADPPPGKTNYLRRALGAAVCLGPGAIVIASLVVGFLSVHGGAAGVWIAAIGLLLGGLNAYLSFGRPLLYGLSHGGMKGYKFVSVVPLFGTLAVTLAAILYFGAEYTAIVGLVALFVDTGGLPWFLVMTWRSGSLWDA
jgi:hypothetical protein